MRQLDAAERRTLLALARASVEARVRGAAGPAATAHTQRLAEPGAAFVSIHRGGELCGCLGCFTPREQGLAQVVIDMAAAAASEDPRFGPLTATDLESVEIEVSVLGPLVHIAGPDDLVIGRDGVLVDQHGRRGLLLPQVAVRLGWSAEQFLTEACRKAGLPPGAWREGARVHRFEADIFAERPARGDA
ncbi:MAG: AmmeMemoRadiSam system protein A [Vicinamibacterales bacterium]